MMNWRDFFTGVCAGVFGFGLIIFTLGSISNNSEKSECSRWNHGAVCELVWMPKEETK